MKWSYALLGTATCVVLTIALTQSVAAQKKKVSAPATKALSPKAMARFKSQNESLRRAREAYKGIKIAYSEELERSLDRTAKAKASRILEAVDFVPDQRLRHFAWLVAKHSAVIVGWRGTVVNAAPIPDGMRVKMKVEAVTHFGASLGTTDCVFETYDLANGQAELLEIQELPADRVGIMIN